MEEITPTSDPALFPFELTVEQAQNLDNLTAEQWIKHCQNVRSNHPRTEPEIDHFLSLPIEEIVRVFRGAVKHLIASSPPTNPPTPSPTPSTSTSSPSISLPTTDIPACVIRFTPDQIRQYREYTDRQYLTMAMALKDKPNRKKGPLKTFLAAHPAEAVAASIKQLVRSQPLPPQQ